MLGWMAARGYKHSHATCFRELEEEGNPWVGKLSFYQPPRLGVGLLVMMGQHDHLDQVHDLLTAKQFLVWGQIVSFSRAFWGIREED